VVDVQAGPAQDMDQLKEAVSSAAAGTGEVQRVIKESTFQPRAAAFTSLIQQCARARAWQKAVDVFQALQETPGLKVCHVKVLRKASSSLLSQFLLPKLAALKMAQRHVHSATSTECRTSTAEHGLT